MKVSFDVVIKSGDQDVDMDYGITTLGGTAEVTCLLAEAILRKKIVHRRTAVNPAKTVLKQSFKSSYGQNFDLIVSEPALVAELKRMGRSVFAEVMSYFITESLYLETPQVSQEAAFVIDGLDELKDDIISRIREPLKRMHKINVEKSFDIELNYKKPACKQKVAFLDSNTRVNLFQSKIQQGKITIFAAITRYNSRTGNGRLVLSGEDETIAFGFYMPLKNIREEQKQKLSANLHVNNGKSSQDFIFIELIVSKVVIRSGEIIKYLIHVVS
ncbi:hypothetical protein [Pantoea agglomerans]|uniref:hypothetical protein n=1 Tax=Enterobacter agglomerans TaxID=549 RepID=UPI000760D35F|nr:hypothetical protein [Pantoea agglomerans]